jgi:Family of unknown function (DUF5681)
MARKGQFQPGVSGNPAGRPRRAIADLSREARKYTQMALDALVEILQKGEERNRVACAKEILDRGHGRSVQAIDLVLMGRKITELSRDELLALDAMFVSAGVVSTEESPAQEAVH